MEFFLQYPFHPWDERYIYLDPPFECQISAPKRSVFGGVVLGGAEISAPDVGGFRYVSLVNFSMVNVGTYTINGCYGIRSFNPFSKAGRSGGICSKYF